MANGQPGFGDSLFKLATQRQTALRNEQIRKRNEDTLRRNDINTLSGFDAASIEGDQQRSIFEEAVADVQSYITGTGEYEDATYDPVNFQKQINKIKSLYNGFTAHNAGDVKSRKDALNTDAYTAGGVDQEGGSLGIRIKTNNTPSSYNQAVSDHNNYFEAAKTPDGKAMFDENGHPMGYPVIDGEVDRTAAPVSLFKMNAYANPENFRGNTVEVPSDTTLDMVQQEKYVKTLDRINNSLEGVEGKPLREVHDMAVSKLFDDKFSSEGQSEFRETLLIDLVKEGHFPSDDEELQQAFINGDFDNENLKPLMKGVREDAEKIYADRSFDYSTQTAYASSRSPQVGSEDSPYASIQQGGIGLGEVGDIHGEYQIKILKEAVAQEGGKFGDYEITGVGVNGEGKRVAQIVEVKKEKNDAGEETEVRTTREIVITPEEGGMGREVYDSLRLQDPRVLGDQHRDWVNMNNALEVEKQAKKVERADGIKAIRRKNPDMTEEKAAEIYDAGGQEAYNLQQRKIEIQPKIDEARDLLSGFDGRSFLKKYINQGMSPEQAKIQVEKDRREAREVGNKYMLLEDLPQAEKDQLLEDLDNFEQSDDPNAPPGITVAEMASIKIKRLAADAKNAPVEGDLDEDGQVGLKEGDEGYVPFGEPGHGYNEYEAIDPYNGETVKGYEAYWLEVVKGQPGFQEPERFRLQREDKKNAEEKQEITSKPIEEVTPEVQAEYDATQEKLRLEEVERLKALEAAGDPDAVEQEGETSSLPKTQTDRSGTLNQETLVNQLQPWEVDLRKQGSGVALLAKNFGNLRPNPANPYASGVYEVSGSNKYQTFDSYEQGLKGLVWDVKAKQFKDGLRSGVVSSDSNVLEALKIWAPAEDKNNPDVYAKNVIKFINEAEGTEYTADSLFSELPTNKLVEAIIRQEDVKLYKKLKEDGFFDDKLASYSEGITKTNKV